MGFFSLLMVASMPVIQFLLIGCLGAFLASGNSSILTSGIRRDMNKIVFAVFVPSLIFSSLAKTVTLQDLISWWFMPINIAITFLIGGTLGWVAVKILRPASHLEGLIIANCSAGNLGNLLLMIIPAVCRETGSPFGDEGDCSVRGLSYVSLSFALGGFIIWTHTYSLVKKDSEKLKKEGLPSIADGRSCMSLEDQRDDIPENVEASHMEPLLPSRKSSTVVCHWKKIMKTVLQIVKELMNLPTIAAMMGFIVGIISWLKPLIMGGNAPLRVIQDSLEMLGDGTVPCMTLILGGNLTSGLKKSAVKPSVVLAIALVRYVALPLFGIAVIKAAGALDFLPQDPLFRYVLLTQFTLPPAMAIGVMAQIFEVGQEECSVILLWLYLGSALALTFWSTVFMYIILY